MTAREVTIVPAGGSVAGVALPFHEPNASVASFLASASVTSPTTMSAAFLGLNVD